MDPRPAASRPPLRLLVVDDQALIRRGLALMLDAEADIEVVGVAGDGEEALALADTLHPDVVIMDLQMPVLSGVVATRRLAERHPGMRIVVLTTFDDDERVFEAVRAGAHAYLLKDASEAEVLDTVRAVQRGESRLSPSVARKVLEQFRLLATQDAHAVGNARPHAPAASPKSEPGAATAPTPPGSDPLSEKENQVLGLIADGLSNREIAARVFLAEGTVKNYVSRIMDKLHAHTRIELALMASDARR